MRSESAEDLAVKNVLQIGFFNGSLLVMIDMLTVYERHLAKLKEQQTQFWSSPNRPPNHYPRTIALRLARLYTKEKKRAPTFGMSREGNFPSTDFGRALEKIFKILGIDSAVRNPAEWAIGQLTPDDFRDTSGSGLDLAMAFARATGREKVGLDKESTSE